MGCVDVQLVDRVAESSNCRVAERAAARRPLRARGSAALSGCSPRYAQTRSPGKSTANPDALLV
jgi:hypothetical protein